MKIVVGKLVVEDRFRSKYFVHLHLPSISIKLNACNYRRLVGMYRVLLASALVVGSSANSSFAANSRATSSSTIGSFVSSAMQSTEVSMGTDGHGDVSSISTDGTPMWRVARGTKARREVQLEHLRCEVLNPFSSVWSPADVDALGNKGILEFRVIASSVRMDIVHNSERPLLVCETKCVTFALNRRRYDMKVACSTLSFHVIDPVGIESSVNATKKETTVPSGKADRDGVESVTSAKKKKKSGRPKEVQQLRYNMSDSLDDDFDLDDFDDAVSDEFESSAASSEEATAESSELGNLAKMMIARVIQDCASVSLQASAAADEASFRSVHTLQNLLMSRSIVGETSLRRLTPRDHRLRAFFRGKSERHVFVRVSEDVANIPEQKKSVVEWTAGLRLMTHLISDETNDEDDVRRIELETQSLLGKTLIKMSVDFAPSWENRALRVQQSMSSLNAALSQQQMYALTDMLSSGNLSEEAILCTKIVSSSSSVVDEQDEGISEGHRVSTDDEAKLSSRQQKATLDAALPAWIRDEHLSGKDDKREYDDARFVGASKVEASQTDEEWAGLTASHTKRPPLNTLPTEPSSLSRQTSSGRRRVAADSNTALHISSSMVGLARWLEQTKWAQYDFENKLEGWLCLRDAVNATRSDGGGDGEFEHVRDDEDLGDETLVSMSEGIESVEWDILSAFIVNVTFPKSKSNAMRVYFNKSRTGWCCPLTNKRGCLLSTRNGLRTYGFLVPEDAGAPTVRSLLEDESLLEDDASYVREHYPTFAGHDSKQSNSSFPPGLDTNVSSGGSASSSTKESHVNVEDVVNKNRGNASDDTALPASSTKDDGVRRFLSAKPKIVNVSERLKAAEQLNRVVAASWLDLKVDIKHMCLCLMQSHSGFRPNDGGDSAMERVAIQALRDQASTPQVDGKRSAHDIRSDLPLGLIGVMVIRNLKVTVDKSVMGPDGAWSGMDMTATIRSMEMMGRAHFASCRSCLTIRGNEDDAKKDNGISLVYGKRYLPFTHARPRAQNGSFDLGIDDCVVDETPEDMKRGDEVGSDEHDFGNAVNSHENVLRSPSIISSSQTSSTRGATKLVSVCGDDSNDLSSRRVSSSGKPISRLRERESITDASVFQIKDPEGGLESRESSDGARSVADEAQTNVALLDGCAAMAVELGSMEIWYTANVKSLVDWYMYPPPHIARAMSQEVRPAQYGYWGAAYYQDMSCSLMVSRPIYIGIVEQFDAFVSDTFVLQMLPSLEYSYSMRRRTEDLNLQMLDVRATRAVIRGDRIDKIYPADMSDALQPSEMSLVTRTRPGLAANEYKQTRKLELADLDVRAGVADFKILWHGLAQSNVETTAASKRESTPASVESKVHNRSSEDGNFASKTMLSSSSSSSSSSSREMVTGRGGISIRTERWRPRRPVYFDAEDDESASDVVLHDLQDNDEMKCSRVAAAVAIQASLCAKAADEKARLVVRPVYEVLTEINVAFIRVMAANDAEHFGIPIAQIFLRYLNLRVRQDYVGLDLIASATTFSVVCYARGYNPNVSTWEELTAPWTLSVCQSVGDVKSGSTLGGLSTRSLAQQKRESKAYKRTTVKTAGVIDVTMSVAFCNLLMESYGVILGEIGAEQSITSSSRKSRTKSKTRRLTPRSESDVVTPPPSPGSPSDIALVSLDDDDDDDDDGTKRNVYYLYIDNQTGENIIFNTRILEENSTRAAETKKNGPERFHPRSSKDDNMIVAPAGKMTKTKIASHSRGAMDTRVAKNFESTMQSSLEFLCVARGHRTAFDKNRAGTNVEQGCRDARRCVAMIPTNIPGRFIFATRRRIFRLTLVDFKFVGGKRRSGPTSFDKEIRAILRGNGAVYRSRLVKGHTRTGWTWCQEFEFDADADSTEPLTISFVSEFGSFGSSNFISIGCTVPKSMHELLSHSILRKTDSGVFLRKRSISIDVTADREDVHATTTIVGRVQLHIEGMLGKVPQVPRHLVSKILRHKEESKRSQSAMTHPKSALHVSPKAVAESHIEMSRLPASRKQRQTNHLEKVEPGPILLCDVALHGGGKIVRISSALSVINRLSWPIDVKFSSIREKEQKRSGTLSSKEEMESVVNVDLELSQKTLGPGSSHFVPLHYLDDEYDTYLQIRPSDVNDADSEVDETTSPKVGCRGSSACWYGKYYLHQLLDLMLRNDEKSSSNSRCDTFGKSRKSSTIISFNASQKDKAEVPKVSSKSGCLVLQKLALRSPRFSGGCHSVWIFVVLSTTDKGVRQLSFHHTVRVQNLLPVTVSLRFFSKRPRTGSKVTDTKGADPSAKLTDNVDDDDDSMTNRCVSWLVDVMPGDIASAALFDPGDPIALTIAVPSAALKTREEEAVELPAVESFLMHESSNLTRQQRHKSASVSGSHVRCRLPETWIASGYVRDNVGRKLQLCIELDFAATRADVASQREFLVRIWCPLWIINHTSVPLVFESASALEAPAKATIPMKEVIRCLESIDGENDSSSRPMSMMNPPTNDVGGGHNIFSGIFSKRFEKSLRVATEGTTTYMSHSRNVDDSSCCVRMLFFNDTNHDLKLNSFQLERGCSWIDPRAPPSGIVRAGRTFVVVIGLAGETERSLKIIGGRFIFEGSPAAARKDDSRRDSEEYPRVELRFSYRKASPGSLRDHCELLTRLPFHGAFQVISSRDRGLCPTVSFVFYELDVDTKVINRFNYFGKLSKQNRGIGWQIRSFYMSAGGQHGMGTSVSVRSESGGWPRLMWEPRNSKLSRNNTNWAPYKGFVLGPESNFEVQPFYGREYCFRLENGYTSLFIEAFDEPSMNAWMGSLQAALQVSKARREAARRSKHGFSLQGAWSDSFNFALTGTQGCIQLKHSGPDTTVREIGVVNTQASGIFYRTKIVHFTERYMIQNACKNVELCIKQDNEGASEITLRPNDSRVPFIWSSDHFESAESDKTGRKVRVNIAKNVDVKQEKSQCLWSEPFSIDRIGIHRLKMWRVLDSVVGGKQEGALKEQILLNVDVKARESTIFVTFRLADATSAPFEIRNECSLDILHVMQKGEINAPRTVIEPFQSNNMLWDSISAPRMLDIFLIPVEVSSSVRDVYERGMRFVTLKSRKGAYKGKVFNSPIALVTISKVKNNVTPVSKINWGYEGNELWVDRGLHAKFRVILGDAREIENSSESVDRSSNAHRASSYWGACAHLRVNPTVVGVGDRRVDGEILESTMYTLESRRAVVIVVAVGAKNVVIVSDLPLMYQQIYPFKLYEGGMRDMVERNCYDVLEERRKCLSRLVEETHASLNSMIDALAAANRILGTSSQGSIPSYLSSSASPASSRMNELPRISVATKAADGNRDRCSPARKTDGKNRDIYLWIEPVDARDLRPGALPVIQVRSVSLDDANGERKILKPRREKMTASRYYDASGVSVWNECDLHDRSSSNERVPLVLNLEKAFGEIHDVRSGEIVLTVVDANWKQNRSRGGSEFKADFLGAIRVPMHNIADGRLHDMWCTVWKNAYARSSRAGSLHIRAILCEKWHLPHAKRVSSAIREARVFSAQRRILRRLDARLVGLGHVPESITQREEKEYQALAERLDVVLGHGRGVCSASTRADDVDDGVCFRSVAKDDHSKFPTLKTVPRREAVVELVSAEGVPVRTGTEVYVALSLRRRASKFPGQQAKNVGAAASRFYDSVKYSDMEFTTNARTKSIFENEKSERLFERIQTGDLAMSPVVLDDVEVEERDTKAASKQSRSWARDRGQAGCFDVVFDVKMRELGLCLRQIKRDLVVIRVAQSTQQRHPSVRPGLHIVAARPVSTGLDRKWVKLRWLTPAAAKRKLFRLGRPIEIRFRKDDAEGDCQAKSHIPHFAQSFQLGPVDVPSIRDEMSLRIAMYRRNHASSESVRVFDESSRRFLSELASFYGDSLALAQLAKSNLEKEPLAPGDKLLGECVIDLDVSKDYLWKGSALLFDPGKHSKTKDLPQILLKIKWTESEPDVGQMYHDIISVSIPGVGLSLIDSGSYLSSQVREVAYFGLSNLDVHKAVFGDGREMLKINIGSFQIDNPLPDAHYRCVLSPRLHESEVHVESASAKTGPWLSFVSDKMAPNVQNGARACFSVIHLSIGDFDFSVDSEWIFAIITLLDRLDFDLMNASSSASSRLFLSYRFEPAHERDMLRSAICVDYHDIESANESGEGMSTIGDEIHYDTLFISSFDCEVSLRIPDVSSILDRVSFLSSFPTVRSVVSAVASSLASLEDATLRVKAIYKRNETSTLASIQDEIANLIFQDVVSALYKSVGSLDIIGNPVYLFQNISRGFYDLLYLPTQGLSVSPTAVVQGLRGGATSLVRSAGYGITHSIAVVLASFNRVVIFLTFDDDFRSDRNAMIARVRGYRSSEWGPWEKAFATFKTGMVGLAHGFVDAASGLVYRPCVLAQSTAATTTFSERSTLLIDNGDDDEDDGTVDLPQDDVEPVSGCSVVRFGRGVIVGTVGVALKPVAAILDAISFSMDSLSIVAAGEVYVETRLRPPRYIKDNRIIIHYVRHEASGERIVRKVRENDPDAFQGLYIFHVPVVTPYESQRRALVVTAGTIALVDCRKWMPVWSADIEDVDTLNTFVRKINLHFLKIGRYSRRQFCANALSRSFKSKMPPSGSLTFTAKSTHHVQLLQWCFDLMRDKVDCQLVRAKLRGKQLLLQAIADLSNVALDQVMSRHIQLLEIESGASSRSSHGDNLSFKALISNTAEVRLKKLLGDRQIHVIEIAVDYDVHLLSGARDYGDDHAAKHDMIDAESMRKCMELKVSAAHKSTPRHAAFSWILLRSFDQIRHFFYKWAQSERNEAMRQSVTSALRLVSKAKTRRRSSMSGTELRRKVSSLFSTERSLQKEALMGNMEKVALIQRAFDLVLQNPLADDNGVFLSFISEASGFGNLEHGHSH
eukprot:g2316.t1